MSCWKRILKRFTIPYAWRPTLATYFAALRNILVGLQTMPRERGICSWTTCAVTTPQPTSIPCLELVADRARTLMLRVLLLFLWTYHIILSSLFGEWDAKETVYLNKNCISFYDKLKWCHSYVSFISCTPLSAYLYYGLPETALISESLVFGL